MCATCSAHLILLELIALISGEEHKLRIPPFCRFLQPPVASSFTGQNILITKLSNILNLISSLRVNDQVSHPYKATDRIIFVYLYVLYRGRNYQKN
jgi:hypothetical protein